MNRKILLTSFSTWMPHHKSNASDDLLQAIAKVDSLTHSLTFLRQLPVDVREASERAIALVRQLQPDIILCCGMAEIRHSLSLESNARGETIFRTPINLDTLLSGLDDVNISHDAGKFVCEGLYYSVLKEIEEKSLASHALFVHVPVITPNNSAKLLKEMLQVIQRMSAL